MTRKILDIFVEGPAQGKGRHRSSAKLKWVHGKPQAYVTHYACPKSKEYEKTIKSYLIGQKITLSDRPIRVKMTECRAIPKSYPEWKEKLCYLGYYQPTSKPDLDNITKAAWDALNGLIWHDDAQVVENIACKVFERSEGLRIQVMELVESMPVTVNTKKEADQFLASHNTSVDELLA